MTYFFAGLAIFFIPHFFTAIRSREPGKDLREKVGYAPYMATYVLISVIGLGLIIYGYGQMRPSVVLYTTPGWMQHLNSAFMLPALILLAASELPAGRIKKAMRGHPMLVSIKLWALGHLLANGELNSVLLFGSFFLFAVFDRIMVKKRGDYGVGPEVTLSARSDLLAIILGFGLWGVIAFWLHPALIGVPAIPVH